MLTTERAPTGQIWKPYYFAGSQTIAMRVQGDPVSQNNGVFFLHSDHLGSASLTTNASGAATARQLYDAWGNIRASASSGTMPTDIGYTGQRLDTSTGLMYYRARYYAQGLGRFISADTIVPDGRNPQAFNRYAYVRNNPLKYTDPTGHIERYDEGGGGGLTCQQTNTCVTFWEYAENVILPVVAWFSDAAEIADQVNQCRKVGCTAGDVLLTLIPTGIGKVFKGGAKAINRVDNVADGIKSAGKIVDRIEIIQTLGEAMQPYLKRVKAIAGEGSQVGFRGSLAKGIKGQHKGLKPFNPSDFDVDAFIVSDSLAAQFGNTYMRGGNRVSELEALQVEIYDALKGLPEFQGLRPDGFSFRIYTSEEAKKLSEAVYFIGGN